MNKKKLETQVKKHINDININHCLTVFLAFCRCFKTIKIYIRKKFTLPRAAFLSRAWGKCFRIWNIGLSFTIETKYTNENQVEFLGI